jgi:glyoxylase-like metal-dependent hydrolase (beta-lactamase superfamily II)
MCYLLNSEVLFTGDTLFVDSVGRPDLKGTPEESRERARYLYASLTKLFTLDAYTLVLPCHTGKPIAFDRQPISTTIGAVSEKLAQAMRTEEAFINRTLEHLPPTPENHLTIIELNERGELPRNEVFDLEAGGNRCSIG